MRTNIWAVFALTSLLALLPGAASAGTITLEFLNTNTFTDGSPAVVPGCSVCLTMTFTDISATEVSLEIESFLGPDEKVQANGGFFFNFDPAKNLGLLSFSLVDRNTSYGAAIVSTGTNAFQAGGDGLFDINMTWSAQGNAVFLNGDYQKYTITSTEPIDIDDFLFLSAPSGGSWGPYYAAVHVGSIPGTNCPSTDPNCNSAWMFGTPGDPPPTIPEPGTMLLVGTGLVGLIRTLGRRAK